MHGSMGGTHSLANPEAEAAVCGALMCHGSEGLADRIAETLKPEHFSETVYARIYEVVVRERALGHSTSPVALRLFLEHDLAQLGGASFLYNLTGGGVPLVTAVDCARQIEVLAQERRLVDGLQGVVQTALEDPDVSLESLIALADDAVSAVRDRGSSADEFSGAECLDLVIDGFDQPLGGVTCGIIPSLDEVIGPLRPTNLIVGAGRPGMGKSLTAQSYAIGAAERGHGVVFFSLEMGSEALGERMAADMCLAQRIPHEAIRDRRLTASQKMEVCRARERLAELPLVVVQKGGLTLGSLRSRIRRHKRRMAAKGQKLELVIVDYLQLLRVDRQVNSQYEAVSEISRTLKEIAMEEEVAVLALTQLSRAVEQRADKRPVMSDLRDSGQIEQDADTILFFLREEYYLRTEGEPREGDPRYDKWHRAMEACQGRIEFICAKRRHGRTGSAMGEFLGAYQAVRG